MQRKPALIAYDICSNKRRRKVFRCLESWRLDSQYSVFETHLTYPEAKELFLQLTELIDLKEDKLMLVWIDSRRDAVALTKAAQIN